MRCAGKVIYFRLLFMAVVTGCLFFLVPGESLAETVFGKDDVVVIGHNFVTITPRDDGVTMESRKGAFEPVKFLGVEGTAAMLFLYNRITRDKGVDLVLKAYEGRIDRAFAAENVDRVLQVYADNNLVHKSGPGIKPNTNYGIARFRI